MSEIPSDEGEENHLIEKHGEKDVEEPVQSDDEDDYEGYFLESAGNNVNIVEKIAEANKKLLEELKEEKEDENRPRKVQFSEDLVNFEPNYYSDDDYTESAQNSVISEEDLELKTIQDSESHVKTDEQITPTCLGKTFNLNKSEEDIHEDIPEELVTNVISIPNDVIDNLNEKNREFILVLLSKEQNSSCESIIGEEISEEKCRVDEKETKFEAEKFVKTKIVRPKSAKKFCEVSKISPNLNCSSSLERRSWQSRTNPLVRAKSRIKETEKKSVCGDETKVQIKGKVLKKINLDENNENLRKVSTASTLKKCESRRPRSCYGERCNGGNENRPNTAPMNRTCCVIKTELPQYNGLRSEYGLSAEQLQERKQKGLENKQKKKQELLKKRQEEIKKRNENEETFQKWLFNKTKKALKKKPPKLTDTLTRSDVYIQTHASYATNRSYCLNYNIYDKNINRRKETHGKKNKTIIVEKLLENMTPHLRKSFNIYLGVKPQFV